jgi:hypothetical protein
VIPPWNGQFGKYLKSLKNDAGASVLSSETTQAEKADNGAVN